MEELLRQAKSIARSAWKHRRLGLLVSWLVGVIAVSVILSIPDKYEASARIFVDTQSILKPLMSGLAVQPNVEQQVLMLSRTLISRPNVEKLIRMADLDLDVQGKVAKDDMIDEVSKRLQIKSTGRDNLYTLSYQDQNPSKAERVVQALASIFVESSLGGKRQDSDSARKFIDDKIRNYEKKLETAESRLKEFKLRNIEMQFQDGKDAFARMSEIGGQLSQARLDLREAENSREALRRQFPAEQAKATGVMSVPTPEIDERITIQKKYLDVLLQRYTELHPDVINSRRILRDLDAQKKAEIQEKLAAASANPGSINPGPGIVNAELSRAMASAEVAVASLRVRVGEYESRFARMKEHLKIVPQLEAELAQLNRDYEINKKNYEQLVTRRESAELTGDLESAAAVADFRLIDPPRVSPKPVYPNRLLLLPLGLLLSLASGLFVAVAAGQIRPVFFDGEALREVTGLPVLGVVSQFPDPARRRRERAQVHRFLLGVSALVVAYAAGIGRLFWQAQKEL
jgi:polysaccharide chain length determinant protein (PEP-CTERM system associated)